MKIPLPLPATLTSRFVVAVERLPRPVPDLVPWRVAKPYRKAAMTAYGTPGLEVTHYPTPWRGVTTPSGSRAPRRPTPPPHRAPAWSPATPHPRSAAYAGRRIPGDAEPPAPHHRTPHPLPQHERGTTLPQHEHGTPHPAEHRTPHADDRWTPRHDERRTPYPDERRTPYPDERRSPYPDERRIQDHTERWISHHDGDGCRFLHHDERRLLRRARQHLVVSSTAPPHQLPGSAQVARATARALARQCGGLVIDPLTGATVPSCDRCPDEPVVFRLADDWLGWDVQVHDDATCPPWDPADTAACDCLRVTSRGLRRFALPEITIDGAACAHTLCATNLLRTVARHLLADHLAFLATHPRADVRLIDDHLHIRPPGDPTPWGEPPEPPEPIDPAATPAHREAPWTAGGASVVTASRSATSSALAGPSFDVRLTPCETEPPVMGRPGSVRRLKVAPVSGTGQATCLKVGPPSGFTGSLNDWLCATQEASPPRPGPAPYPLAA
ncbi:hypothetical protein [Nonomuraea roseoviolacea]|uniref:SWIM-type domain-containing protein n=1 Tax=Nonomuraea roseoviolacea subsp. carminata TaxID=160689 RepID=A0ABT1JVL8_9ACTN|nr:hypothetical protein [Nonomuraea roseoviolacea]MCP2345447.1 hypothetical protein [Nonomuraea roseoviolacea subsp. carminata]